MITDKYVRLMKLLLRRTETKAAAWEATSREGVFAWSLPDYTVTVSLAGQDGQDVKVEVVNDEGVVIDSFTDRDLHSLLASAYVEMFSLYQQAKRQALGVDGALDKLISELDAL